MKFVGAFLLIVGIVLVVIWALIVKHLSIPAYNAVKKFFNIEDSDNNDVSKKEDKRYV